MEINTAGKWIVFAYGLPDHASPGEAVTGDAANITANIRIDGGAANAVDDTNPTELEDGYYIFDITAVESNGDLLLLAPASSTANVQVIAVPGAVWTRPANFNVFGIASDGDISGNVDGSVAGSVASVSGAVGSVTGSVASVTGAVGSVTAAVVTDAASRTASKADVSGLATSASITALNDFDYTTEKVTLAAATHTGAVIPTVSTLTGHTAQTADHTANIAAILVDTGTTLDGKLDDIQGATFSASTDSLEAIRDRGDAAWLTGAGGSPPQLLQSTTIATLASQSSFTLTAGSADDNAYNGAVVVVTDSVTSVQKAVGEVSDYTGSTKTVTLSADPAIFTMAAGDTVEIIAALGAAGSGATASQVWTYATRVLTAGTNLNDIAATDIVSGGAINTTAGAVDTVTTNTDMRGTESAATAANLATVDGNVDAILLDTGTTLPAQIAGLNDFDPALDAVANVTLVATTTTNTDMRGTDSAALAIVATESRLSELDAVTAGKMANQVDVIQTDTTTDIPALIAALNDLASSDILTTALTESYSADGAEFTLSQAMYLITQFLYERTTAGTAVAVKKLDGSSTAAGLTLDDATTPTSITRSS